MYKEFALYKANRDLLDKRYNLKTEEQRVREIEFAHNIKESQQQLEIEMKKAKDTEVQQIEKDIEKKANKKADEAAMVKYKDIIDKLKMEIEKKQRELDKKDEESKLMNVKIEKLQYFKSACLRGLKTLKFFNFDIHQLTLFILLVKLS